MHEKTFKIRREYGEQWCAALRTGDYEQCYGVLHENNTRKYCCLGVFCDLVKDSIELNIELAHNEDIARSTTHYNGAWAELPGEVVVLAGITDMNGEPIDNPTLGPHTASEWNDEYGANFQVIAELIEYFGEFYDD